jgi:hypothetical protein
MNDDREITAALELRFGRARIPECPSLAWGALASRRAPRRARPRGYAYALAALVVLVSGGVATQASGALSASFAKLFNRGSSTPLPPMIHAADRLTVAQAQQHVAFPIVVPTGLPQDATFEYAHVIPRSPVASVVLYYQAKIDGEYYRIIIQESSAVKQPEVAYFEVQRQGKNGLMHLEKWTLPMRVWKHGATFMEMLPQGLPNGVVDRIVRQNSR